MRYIRNFFKIFDQEWFKGVLFAVIAVGIIAMAFGAWKYFDITRQLEDNPAYQAQHSDNEVEIQSEAQAQVLMAADISRRRLEADRYQAMMIGGIGLSAAAAGWFLLDITLSRKRRTEMAEPTPIGDS